MSRARVTAGIVLAYVLALGASVACATGDEKVQADPPSNDDPNRPLEAGVADAPQEDVATPPSNGCSSDGFCSVPVPSSKPLIAVSAASADEAWMLPEQSGAILRWNGTAIEQLYEYDGATPSSISFADLWAAKKDDVWAAATDSDNHHFFVHYAAREGAAPSFRELPTQEPVTAIHALWGTSDGSALWVATENSIYRVREDASGAVLEDLHPSLGAGDEQGYAWRGVWGFAPDDVFVAGKVCPTSPCGWESRGAIAHYDGDDWSITTLDATSELTSLSGTPAGTERQLWYDATEEVSPGVIATKTHLVTAKSDGQLGADVYTHLTTDPPACSSRLGRAASSTVGWFSAGGLLCRWNGTSFIAARTAVGELPMFGALNGIWAGGTDDVWVVGAAVTRTGLPPAPMAARRTATTAQASGGKP